MLLSKPDDIWPWKVPRHRNLRWRFIHIYYMSTCPFTGEGSPSVIIIMVNVFDNWALRGDTVFSIELFSKKLSHKVHLSILLVGFFSCYWLVLSFARSGVGRSHNTKGTVFQPHSWATNFSPNLLLTFRLLNVLGEFPTAPQRSDLYYFLRVRNTTTASTRAIGSLRRGSSPSILIAQWFLGDTYNPQR